MLADGNPASGAREGSDSAQQGQALAAGEGPGGADPEANGLPCGGADQGMTRRLSECTIDLESDDDEGPGREEDSAIQEPASPNAAGPNSALVNEADLEAGIAARKQRRPKSLTFQQLVQQLRRAQRPNTSGTSVQDEGKENARGKADSAASLSNDRAFIADSALPQTKLEVLSEQGTGLIIFLFLSASALAVALSTYIIQSLSTTMREVPGIIAMEGSILLLTSAILLFLVVSFPQRIIARRIAQQRILPQQILIALLIVYLALVPDYGIPSVALFWADYRSAVDRVKGLDLTNEEVFVYLITENDATANAASQLSISLLLFFWASMLQIAGYYSFSIEIRLKQLKLRSTKKNKRRALFVNASTDEGEGNGNDGEEANGNDEEPSDFEHTPSDMETDVSESFPDSEEEDDDDESDSDDILLRRSKPSRMDEYMATSKRGRFGPRRRKTLEETQDSRLYAVAMEKEKRLSPIRFRLQEAVKRFTSSVAVIFRTVRGAMGTMSLCSCYYGCCCFFCCSFKRCVSQTSMRGVLRRGMAWKFAVALALYTIIFAVIENTFDYTCSLVPFVGMITVFRVCAATDSNGIGYCSSQEYPEAFHRSLATTGLFVIEVGLFAYIGDISKRVYRRMAAVPYALNRPNYLGVAFTQVSTAAFWFVVFLLAVIELSLPNVSVFVKRPVIKYSSAESRSIGSIEFDVDPLYTVGITSSAITFSSVGLCVSIWTLIIAYAWLPADSSRLAGWFVGTPPAGESPPPSSTDGAHNSFDMIKGESLETILERYFDENPVLISSERRFRRIFMLQHKAGPAQTPRESRRQILLQATGISSRLLFEGAAPPETPCSPAHDEIPGVAEHAILHQSARTYADSLVSVENLRTSRNRIVQRQLLSHVLVVETEIALFNFTGLAYECGPEPWRTPPETVAELAATSPEYTLIGHVVDKAQDTHVVVAKSVDRIIVGFRGTVSSKNIDTDLDWKLVRHPQACDVKPLPSATPLERAWSEKEPTVHRGFLRAYEGVREELHALIDPLIMPEENVFGEPRQRRALLCTGHSLGGALAVICAFDFACTLDRVLTQAERPAVGCTTFGCPRVGSYSFLKRFRRMVPATKRFVLMSDIIPRQPPRLFRGAYAGYHHVGIELLLDLNGNLLISAHSVERAILHGFRRVIPRMHFCTRYCLALVLWCSRMKIDPDLWPFTINQMISDSKNDILSRHQDLFRASHGVFMKEGVITNLIGAVPRRNISTQASPDEIASELERAMPLTMDRSTGPASDSDLEQLSRALSQAIEALDHRALTDEHGAHGLSRKQLQALQRLVQESAVRKPSLRAPKRSLPPPPKRPVERMPSLSEAAPR